MKGHTTIELTNVKTGEVQVIEEDNIVTNYLPELLRPHYPFKSNWNESFDTGTLLRDAASLNPAVNPYHDFGGLIMFRDSLDSDPDKYHPDVSLTMTAHASNDVYIGADLTRGSFNKNLSDYNVSWTPDAPSPFVRLVWDFGLEQGNGTIGTVCVCNPNDGKIGFGSQYPVSANLDEMALLFHHSQFSPMSNFNPYVKEVIDPATTTNGLSSTSNLQPVFYDSKNGRLVCIDHTMIYGDSIRFVVIDTNSNSIQPINIRSVPNLNGSSQQYPSNVDTYWTPYQYYRCEAYYFPFNSVVNVFVSSKSDSYASYYGKPIANYLTLGGVCADGTYWYFGDACYAQNTAQNYGSDVATRWTWKAGTAKILVKVDLRTMESQEISVTNTTGVDLVMLAQATTASYISGILVHNNYLIFRNSDGYLYRINLANNSDVKRATWLDEDTPLSVTAPSNYPYSSRAYFSSWDYLPSIFQYVLGNYMFFSTGRCLNVSASTTAQLRVLDLDTFVAKYVDASARATYPCYCAFSGVQTINGFDGGAYPYCSSDCEIIPVRTGSETSYSWNDTTKAIYHRMNFKHLFKPMGLITINTLAEPVTKTADMTMRITYTLTA